MPASPLVRARRRRRLWAWVPTILAAVVCGGFVLGAVAMQNSWWTATSPPPSSDQRAADGSSRFDRSGEDFFVREGIARITLRADGASARALGLDEDGARTIEPLVPVTVIVRAPDGVFAIESVTSMTLVTTGDRLREVTLSPDLPGSWQSAAAEVQRTAQRWGWSATEIAAVSDDLAAAAHESPDGAYAASLEPRQVHGIRVSGEVRVDGSVSVSWTLAAVR